MKQNVFQQEKRAVRTLMFKEKEQAILNRIRYLKQQCICWFICRGEYRLYSWRWWIWSYNFYLRSRASMQRIDGPRNKTCQGIVLIFRQSSTFNTLNANSLGKLSMWTHYLRIIFFFLKFNLLTENKINQNKYHVRVPNIEINQSLLLQKLSWTSWFRSNKLSNRSYCSTSP